MESYLKEFIGESYIIDETAEKIYIGADLPDEYKGSRYTEMLKGALAKAKANAAQGIPEMIQICTNKKYEKDYDNRHGNKAKHGWYRYETRFALPVSTPGEHDIERYNVFKVQMLVRHDADDKKYLYDMVNIKKETGNLFRY